MVLYLLGILVLVAFGANSAEEKILARLVGGKNKYEGRIEVKYKGEWKGVCPWRWGMRGARAACRSAGFPDALRYVNGTYFGPSTSGFWLDEVLCNKNSPSLSECHHRTWGQYSCDKSNPAGAVCKSADEDIKLGPQPSQASGEVSGLKVQLLGPVEDDLISEGVVQVEREGRWGYICPTRWGYSEARVVCGQLGFPDAAKSEEYRAEPTTKEVSYWMDNVTCSGTESSLVSCDHQGWGAHQCQDDHVVRVTCVRSDTHKHPGVRLRSGAQVWEGRVEVKIGRGWGTVCDDDWDLLDASVVCRSLGYGSAAYAVHRAYYGQGMLDVLMDDVNCTGLEQNLTDCRSIGKRQSDCKDGHYEDAGVQCHAPALHGHQIRLIAGRTAMEGRVEVYKDGQWGTVCGDYWHIEEAMVVCRHLGLGFASEAVTKATRFRGIKRPTLMSGVDCRHDERSLYHCINHQNVTCSSRWRIAGVVCVRELPDLALHTRVLKKSIGTRHDSLASLTCAYEETCLSKSAGFRWPDRWRGYTRDLLKFTSYIENQGRADFKPRLPKRSWQWHACHRHYHSMEVFTHYDLLSAHDGKKVAEGHKASFCLEDTKCDYGVDKTYACKARGNQGLSPNCHDIYGSKLDCQWIDVTDVFAGKYVMRINVNPQRQVAESDFTNNIVICEVTYYGSFAHSSRCSYKDCESGVDTHSGNSNGACCHLPFKFRGKLYNSCTREAARYRWCATTSDYDRDRKYGMCFTED